MISMLTDFSPPFRMNLIIVKVAGFLLSISYIRELPAYTSGHSQGSLRDG